jgi:hypothetical protein
LFWHCDLAAASRTFCTAGNSKPIKMAMIAITTSSSISVKAFLRGEVLQFMKTPQVKNSRIEALIITY